MYIPSAFDSGDRGAVRTRLLGRDHRVKAAILTPLDLFFGPLATGPRSRGWWPSTCDDGVLLALTPQGPAILDLVCALEPGTRLTFLGLAGSLSRLTVGDVCEPDRGYLEGAVHQRRFPGQALFPTASIATVGCLAESTQRQRDLRAVAECVDMETGLLYAAGALQNKPVRSIVVISDHVDVAPFHRVEPGACQHGIDRTIETLRGYLAHEREAI